MTTETGANPAGGGVFINHSPLASFSTDCGSSRRWGLPCEAKKRRKQSATPPPPLCVESVTPQGYFDAVPSGPFSVDHINGFVGAPQAPTSVLVDLFFGRFSESVLAKVPTPGDVRAASSAVAVEGPELIFD